MILAAGPCVSMILWAGNQRNQVSFFFSEARPQTSQSHPCEQSCPGLPRGHRLIRPVPLSTRAEGVIWIPEQSFVRARTEGFIDRLLATPGTRVRQGDSLIECSDPLLPARIRVLESKLRELKATYDAQILSDRVQAVITSEEMKNVTGQLEDARRRASELTVLSSAGGYFPLSNGSGPPRPVRQAGGVAGVCVGPFNPHGPGRGLTIGRRLCSVEDFMGADSVRERIAEILPAVVKREVPAATDQLPSRTLSQQGGGELPSTLAIRRG